MRHILLYTLLSFGVNSVSLPALHVSFLRYSRPVPSVAKTASFDILATPYESSFV